MNIDNVLSRLEKVRKNGNGKWRARCPAHGGNNPTSLSIWEPEPDKILLRCHAHECSVSDILASINLEMADIFPERDQFSVHRERPDYYARLHRKETHEQNTLEATIHLYEQDIKKGVKFTQKENAHYRELFLKLKKQKEANQ